jgi:hypothetical protein
MSKEKILEEFDKKYYSKYLLNGDKMPAFEMNNAFLEDVKQFLSQALDQTKEETIRKMEEVLPNRDEIIEDPIGYLERLEEDLNKLKK